MSKVELEERPVSRPRKFWMQEDPVIREVQGLRMVERGGMFPHQRRWWNLPNFVKVLVGGYGSGKTIMACKRAINLALINAPHAPAWILSPTYTLARETTISTMNRLLDGKRRLLGSAVFDYEYNQGSHIWVITYKGRTGRCLQLTGERPERLKGPNLGGGVIDEPFILKPQCFTEMYARVRHPQARVLEIGCTGTPEQLNWGHDMVVGRKELTEGEDKDDEGREPDHEQFRGLDVGVVFASTRDNLALGPKYVERLESVLDKRAAKAYIDGQFVSLSTGLVYYSFDPEENVARIKREEGVELGVGMDFNVNPMAAIVFWRSGSHMHVFDEIELENADTEYMCSELHARGYHKDGLRNVYPDASGNARHTASPGGKSDFSYIRAAGFNIEAPNANPPRRDRYNAVNGKLKPKDGKVSLTISPSCRRLLKYLAQYSHEKMNEPGQKAMSHLLDALGYPIARLWPVSGGLARTLRLQGY